MNAYGIESSPVKSPKMDWLMTFYLLAVLVSISAMELFSSLLGLSFLVLVFMGRVAVPRPSLFVILTGAAFFAVVFSGLAISGRGFSHLGDLKWMALLALLCALIFRSPLSVGQGKAVLCLGILGSLYAGSQFFLGYDVVRGESFLLHEFGAFHRASGPFNNPMTFAHSYGMLFFLPFALFFSGVKGRVFFAVCCLALAFALLVTQTRGMWIGVTCGILFVSFMVSKRAFFGTLILGALGLVLLVAFVPTIRERIVTIVDFGFSNNSMRLDLWRANWAMFLDHPLLGVGYGHNEDLLKMYYEKLGISSTFYSHAHNTYLQFLSSTGVLGLGLYLTLFGHFFLLTIRRFRELAKQPGSVAAALCLASLGAQVAFHVGGLTECNFEDSEVNHMLMVFIAAGLMQRADV